MVIIERIRLMARWQQVLLGMLVAAAVILPSGRLYASRRRAAIVREQAAVAACERTASVQRAEDLDAGAIGACETAFELTGNYRYRRLGVLVNRLRKSSTVDAGAWSVGYAFYDRARDELRVPGRNRDMPLFTARIYLSTALILHILIHDYAQVVADVALLSDVDTLLVEYSRAIGESDAAIALVNLLHVPLDSWLAVRVVYAREKLMTNIGAFAAAGHAVRDVVTGALTVCDGMWFNIRRAVVDYNQDDRRGAVRGIIGADANRELCPLHLQDLIAAAAEATWMEQPAKTLELLKQLESKTDTSALMICGKIATLVHRWNDAGRFFLAADAAARDETDKYWPFQVALATGASLEYRSELGAEADTLAEKGKEFDFSACEEMTRQFPVPIEEKALDSEVLQDLAGCSDPDEYERATVSGLEQVAERYYCRAVRYLRQTVAKDLDHAEFHLAMFRLGTERLIRLRLQQGRIHDALRAVALWAMGSMPNPMAEPPSASKLKRAWQNRDLVILIVPEIADFDRERGEVYRMRIHDGNLSGEIIRRDLTSAEDPLKQNAFRDAAVRLISNADDHDAATTLGTLIPTGDDGREVDVLALGRLGAIPLAALRDADGRLVQERRPIGRVLGLYSETQPTPPSDKLIVMADADGSLPMALAEGPIVQSKLGPSAKLYTRQEVNQEAFADAARADLLHIAGHADLVGLDASLRLSRDRITADELTKHRVAPRVAVIAACGSAAVHDEGAWRTVASAMLRAGSQYVVATDSSVDDMESMLIMDRFYRQRDPRKDPVAAMAQTQVWASEMKGIEPQQWAAFSVLVRPPVISTAAGRN